MKPIVLTALIIVVADIVSGQTSVKQLDPGHGSHAVGFLHYQTSDSTRTYKRMYDWNNKSIPRPISVSIWYPAAGQQQSATKMTVLQYMKILKEEEEWEYLPDEQILNWFYYANTPANQDHLKEQASAYARSKPAAGKFPIVVYAPSYQASSVENFALCEYLASHGYVVIASPSHGAETRPLEGGSEKDMETQARDIEFLIKEVAGWSNADHFRIATMGFSFGGLSNVLSQMRNARIKAIVSLDGSIKYQYPTLKRSPFFNVKKVTIPFIHMAQKDIPQQVLKEDKIDSALNHRFEFYDDLIYSKAYQLKFHNLTHACFSTLGVLFEKRDKRQDKSDAEIMESYKWVSVYALKFLDAFLKKDTAAQTFMNNNPRENGISEELLSKRSKEPAKKAMSFQDFNELAAKQNYRDLYALYTSLKKTTGIELPEGSLNNLGLQLTFNPATSNDGINIFLLATKLYPASANLFDSLAEAYLFTGKTDLAIENFKRSLSLDAHNQNAIDRLKQLSK